MILAIANFFALLFTGTENYFASFAEIEKVIASCFTWLFRLFDDLGWGTSEVPLASVDWFGVLSVVVSVVCLVSVALALWRMIWNLFTLRR